MESSTAGLQNASCPPSSSLHTEYIEKVDDKRDLEIIHVHIGEFIVEDMEVQMGDIVIKEILDVK